MPGDLHEGHVKRLRRDGACVGGFRAALHDLEEWDGVLDWWMGRPDAYRIDEENKTITVYEVEVGKPLSADRIFDYAHLWFCLDCEFWTLRLVTVDRFGVETERPLLLAYFASLEAA